MTTNPMARDPVGMLGTLLGLLSVSSYYAAALGFRVLSSALSLKPAQQFSLTKARVSLIAAIFGVHRTTRPSFC